jgi:hypothetical protein
MAKYTEKQKAKALEKYHAARDEGMPSAEAAAAAGVPYITLRTWERAGEADSGKGKRPRGRPKSDLFKLVFPDGSVWAHEDLKVLLGEARKALAAKG